MQYPMELSYRHIIPALTLTTLFETIPIMVYSPLALGLSQSCGEPELWGGSDSPMRREEHIIQLTCFLQDCAVRVIKGIPRKQLWYCVDWTTFFTLHLYSLWPEFFDMFTRMFVYQTSYAYSDTQHVV